MQLVCHNGKVEYASQLKTMAQNGPNNDKKMANLSRCFLCKFYLDTYMNEMKNRIKLGWISKSDNAAKTEHCLWDDIMSKCLRSI